MRMAETFDWQSARLLSVINNVVGLTSVQVEVVALEMGVEASDVDAALKHVSAVDKCVKAHETQSKSINFARYGNAFNHICLDSLVRNPDCVSRVELSGSEGYYVEVARWSDSTYRWERYAFIKTFHLPTAIALMLSINDNSRFNKIFHTFHTAIDQ